MSPSSVLNFPNSVAWRSLCLQLLTAGDSHIKEAFALFGQLPPWRHKLRNFGVFDRALEVPLISHELIAELFRGQFFVSINLPVWRKCKYMQGKIASKGAGIFFQVSGWKKSIFESTIMDKSSWDTLRKRPVSFNEWVFNVWFWHFDPLSPFQCCNQVKVSTERTATLKRGRRGSWLSTKKMLFEVTEGRR